MSQTEHTPAGKAVTDLVLELFRLNNRLLTDGDRLVAAIGLTSARWKVLGCIAAANQPQPVAWLARDLGGNRQNVQRIVNDLVSDGLLQFQPNPHHRRAHVVVLTEAGSRALNDAMALQTPWINALSTGLNVGDIQTTHQVIAALCKKLEDQSDADTPT